MDPRDKVAIVTGGGSGIGRATVLALARVGATVVAADRDLEAAEETARLAKGSEGRASSARVDVTIADELERLFATVERQHGRVDILHNNAGIITAGRAYPDSAVADWSRMLDVNLRAVILGTQLGIQSMRRSGGGVIVNTASLAGLSGYPTDPVYGAAKGGVVMLTLSLAPLALAERIRVNCVCPGITDTPMVRQARARGEEEYPGFVPPDLPMISPDRVAEGVLTLVRDDSLAGRALKVMVKGQSLEPLPKGAWRPGAD
jgi:NAD(P)-dependent dehydrogenase (short-subunit alcohol dehydrogenase family)